jgi:hypothetical protein
VAGGVKEANITVRQVPGSFELPLAARTLLHGERVGPCMHVHATAARTHGAWDARRRPGGRGHLRRVSNQGRNHAL